MPKYIWFVFNCMSSCVCACDCVCACMRARQRVHVCVCVCSGVRTPAAEESLGGYTPVWPTNPTNN